MVSLAPNRGKIAGHLCREAIQDGTILVAVGARSLGEDRAPTFGAKDDFSLIFDPLSVASNITPIGRL